MLLHDVVKKKMTKWDEVSVQRTFCQKSSQIFTAFMLMCANIGVIESSQFMFSVP